VSLLGVAMQNQFIRKAEGNASGRMVAPIVALEWLSEKDNGWLFGYGFGITKQSYWQQTTGEYAYEYAPKNNQISTALVETGFPGLFLFFSLFISLFVWSNSLAKKLQNFSKSVASVFVCATSLMIIGTIYTNVLTGYYFGFLFWLMFAFLYTLNSHCLKGTQKEIY
jgi:O-antigen ligase